MAIRGLASVDDCRLRQQLDRIVFEESREMLCWTRPDGSILSANQAFRRCLGCDEVKLLELNLRDLELESSQQLHIGRLREIRDHGTLCYEIKLRRDDGAIIPLTIDSQLKKFEGEELILCRIAKKFASSDPNSSQGQRAGEKESHTFKEHHDRLRCMGLISAALAHELNQPLAAISNNAYVLQQILDQSKYPLNDAPDLAAQIYEQAKLSTEIIRRIRSFVSDQPPSQSLVDINSTIRESLKLLDTHLRKSNTEICLDLMQSVPRFCGDRVQIQQVVVNLILNAVQAIDTGDQGKGAIRIRTKADEIWIKFEVEDTGSGIPDPNLKTLFEPFFSTKPDGMGIGLTICKLIVENHHGRIMVTSSTAGTVFSVEFPIAAVSMESC